MAEDAKKVTFWDKNEVECPVCHNTFQKEKLMTGGGRVIAGSVSDELRRHYQDSKKYGYVNPLIYSPTICPHCWFCVLENDFGSNIVKKDAYENLYKGQDDRVRKITKLFEGMEPDYKENRTLESGTAAYILATMCYSFFDTKINPTIKRGICSLRAAWLLGDMEEKYKTGKFSYFQEKFYFKAHRFYNDAIEWAQNGKETLADIYLGPDTDKNYGFDGVVYVGNLLNFKLGPFIEKDPIQLGKLYMKSKISIAKIFGFGRSSKEKPSSLLDTARELYEQIGEEIKRIEDEFGEKIG